ncbi:MAG: AMIN domain-containing protein, partial [Alphaproteobacteria bacterium]|nr:AMIN domain-containing protein [Alphaproteobacteria bacterium]
PPQAAPMPLYNQQPSAASANAAAYIPPAQPVSMASGPGIGHIRFGENKDKTRIVLDAAQQVTFTQDIDNNEQILMVRLPGSAWNTAAQQQVTDSPLVAAYTATPDGAGGTTLAIQLKRPAQVAMAQSLPPGGSKGHRVVIDLAPL